MDFEHYCDTLLTTHDIVMAVGLEQDKLDWAPAFAFVVARDLASDTLREEMVTFCQQLAGRSHNLWTTDFWFELEQDVLMFKLAFGDYVLKLD